MSPQLRAAYCPAITHSVRPFAAEQRLGVIDGEDGCVMSVASMDRDSLDFAVIDRRKLRPFSGNIFV